MKNPQIGYVEDFKNKMKNLLTFARFVDGFLGNEKSTNRKMHYIMVASFLISDTESVEVNWDKHHHFYCGPPKVRKPTKLHTDIEN